MGRSIFMKKVFSLFLLTLISCFSIFAEGESIFSDRPGSFAIYRDLRFEGEAIVGVCYTGTNTLLLRSYEAESGNEVQILMELSLSPDSIDPTDKVKLMKGDINSSPAAQRLMPMILNWANAWYASKDKIEAEDSAFLEADDKYYFRYWVPVFQLEKIGDKKDFTLFSVGMIKDFSDPRFFDIKGLPETVEGPSYKIKKGKKGAVEIDGLSIPLDSNWESKDQRIYTITKETEQDAVCMVETVDYAKTGLTSLKQMARLLMIGNINNILLTDGSGIVFEDNRYTITLRLYDSAQKKISRQETQLIYRGENLASLVTLSSYESLYQKNKSYFDKILH